MDRKINKTIEVKCQWCGKYFKVKPSYIKIGRGKYCSNKCRGYSQRKRIIRICKICGKEFETNRCYLKRGEKRGQYCSAKCKGLGMLRENNPNWKSLKMLGENNPNWKNGKSFEPYSYKFNKQLKELIRIRDNYYCQKCGLSEIENGQKLCIHHIDYNKENCLPSNLVSLCRVCNSIVNFNRSKWKIYFKNRIRINETFKNQLRLKIAR